VRQVKLRREQQHFVTTAVCTCQWSIGTYSTQYCTVNCGRSSQ
jgi:hypothetical protein